MCWHTRNLHGPLINIVCSCKYTSGECSMYITTYSFPKILQTLSFSFFRAPLLQCILGTQGTYNLFSSARSPCAMKDERGFWGIECIKQLNKGCHKGPDSTARRRGTRMHSPSPFVLYRSAPNCFRAAHLFFSIARSYMYSCTACSFSDCISC